MAEIAVSGALALVDRLLLAYPYVIHDVEEVKNLLDTMKGFLKDTDGREDTEGLKDQVKNVRILAHEAEDAIEKYMFQVPEHFHPNQVRQFFHDVARPIKNFGPGIQLSSSMRDIKAKIKGRINDLEKLRIGCSNLPSSSTVAEIPPEACPYSSDEPLVGIERRGEELWRLILNNESRDVVISVLGGAGTGKTTLIYDVYQKVKVTFECHAWVPVSRSCERMLERIWEELELPAYQGTDRRRCLHTHLQQKRYILVLDGIWSEDEWKCIRNVLPCTNQGSRIIVSTRKRNIASYCATSHDFIYDLNLNPLTWEEASELFLKKAFPNGKCLIPCEEWSEKIVKRCEGLPQAIVAIGDILSSKPQTVMEFKKVHDNLEFEPGSLEYIRKFLQSYYHLSPNLKSCFMYFCNFPEDYSVTRGRLIRLWIAEGFIEEKRGQTLEQVADEYLDELVQMSLVQVSRWDCEGRVRSCRVSNLARGFILSKSEKENFVTVITTQTNWSEKHRRLSLHICTTSIPQGKDFSYVRTFSMFGGDKSFELLVKGVFSNFRLLRVLDLENAVLLVFPQQVVTLNLLRYLSLRNTKIDSLPKSIKKLQNLMVLDLRQTSVLDLPVGILEIPTLLYLLVDGRGRNNAIAGVEVPQGIGCLKRLQKLSLIKANNKKGSIVEELGNLIELRKLGITELKNKDGRDFCASIEKMEHLSSLYVESANEFLDLKYVKKPPQMINSLFLGGKLDNIPEWILSLNGLFKLELRWSQLAKSPLEVLWALPSLKVLHLHDAYSGEEFKFGAEWFLELRILVIEQCRWLKCVVIPDRAMPKLQKLTIRYCNNLTMVRMAISTLTRIEETIVPQHLLNFLD